MDQQVQEEMLYSDHLGIAWEEDSLSFQQKSSYLTQHNS